MNSKPVQEITERGHPDGLLPFCSLPHVGADLSAGSYEALYRNILLNEVLPFWMRVGFDDQYGGISNVLDDNGTALSHDKYLWSQGRALWTFSALCNRVEARSGWRRFADHLFAYLKSHGRDRNGHWVYRLDKNGAVLDGAINIYVDGFVLHGLSEYYAVSGNEEALALALETYEQVAKRLKKPGAYKVFPFEIPAGKKTLDVAMAFSWFFHELGFLAGDREIRAAGMSHANEILDQFYNPERNAIVQNIGVDGSFSNGPEGTLCMPGSVFESMWFLMEIFGRSGEMEKVAECCRHLRRHLELGWDHRFGGFHLALDLDGNAPVYYWKTPDCKAWWVQVEALVSTAYAYFHSGEPWCLEWHSRILEWVLSHYPHPGGEWRQWLDREGRPIKSAALPVKDPFHLPRALIQLNRIFGTESIGARAAIAR